MAERLIATWTLTSDLGAGFGLGTRIKTYWDDFGGGYVVKKDVPTLVFGSNVGVDCDSGTYETFDSTWSANPYLTRSSAQAQTGTYSGLYTQPDTSNSLIASQTGTLTGGKTYRVTCYVYVPTVNPFGSATTRIRLVATSPSTPASNEIQISEISEVYDTWTQVSIDVAVLGQEQQYTFNLQAFKGTRTLSGICYVDQFLIRELGEATLSETTITTGPDLGVVNINNVTGYSDYNSKFFTSIYQYCNSSTLVQFRGNIYNPAFPYVYQYTTPNSPICYISGGGGGGGLPGPGQIPYCNISFEQAPLIIKCSNPYRADGEITVTATSTSGYDIRYSLDNVNHSEMTVTNGTFSNLTVGSYTVYARDSNNCLAQITVALTAEETNDGQPTDPTPTYGVMYRMEHTELQNDVEERIDILERNFTGDLTEVNGGPVPFLRSLGEASINNKFDCIRPTYATIQLASERDLQYIGLFSQDDRKYLVNYYKPVGTLKWRGYVTPSVFSEPYTEAAPYITNITVTDNLVQLEELEFLDKDGNKLSGKMTLIKIIALILNKLSLQLQIQTALNISEDTEDDLQALEETQHETSAFYEDNGTPWTCARVLRALLMPFGAKIVQENGTWNIVRVEEQCAQYNRRLYNREGDYISSDNYDPVVDIVGDASLRLNSVFRDRDHTLEVVPAYGKITVVRKLFRRDNLLVNGSFDIEKYADGIIEGWSITSGTVTTYTVTNVIRDTVTDFNAPATVNTSLPNSWRDAEASSFFRTQYYQIPENVDSALEITNLTDQETVVLQSQPISIELTDADSFIFSFNYRVNMKSTAASSSRSARPPDWIRIKYKIQLGSYYFNEVAGWTTDADYEWNSVFVETYEEDQKFEIKARLKGAPSVSIRTLTITFEFTGSNYNDFTLLGVDLPDIQTTTLPSGYRVRGELSGVFSADYKLEDSTDATSSPDVIRPTDYDGTTNPAVWFNTFYKEGGTQYKDIDKLYLYDVNFKFLPNGEEGPNEEVLEAVNNLNYKENLLVELESGDVTELVVNNKKNLYSNIFLDPVGEPTSAWTRFGVGGTNTLQRLLLSSLSNQYKFPTFKISGSILGFEDLNFLTTFKQVTDQPSYSLTNGGFTGNITGWSNYPSAGGPLIAWAYGSNSARVTLASGESSRALRQTNASSTIPFTAGDRVKVSFDLDRTNSSGTRFDWLEIKIYNSSNEVLQNLVVAEMGGDGSWVRTVRFTLIQDAVNIGFNVRNIEGTGTAQYDMNSFEINGLSVVRYFTVNGMEIDSYNNRYNVNLMQLIPITPSADANVDDSGEGNTGTEGGAGGGTSGSGSSTGGDFNNDFNADFYL